MNSQPTITSAPVAPKPIMEPVPVKTSKGVPVIYVVIIVVIAMILTAVISVLAAYLLFGNTKTVANTTNTTATANTTTENTTTNTTAPVVTEPTCDTVKYSNKDYSAFSFVYDCNWTISEDINSSTQTPQYLITLTNGSTVLTFDLGKIQLDGAPTCTTKDYVRLSSGRYRILESSDSTSRTYEYNKILYVKGTADFDAITSVSKAVDYTNESFCYNKELSFQTNSNVVSTNGAGVNIGEAYPVIINPTLKTDITNTTDSLKAKAEADAIIDSMTF